MRGKIEIICSAALSVDKVKDTGIVINFNAQIQRTLVGFVSQRSVVSQLICFITKENKEREQVSG